MVLRMLIRRIVPGVWFLKFSSSVCGSFIFPGNYYLIIKKNRTVINLKIFLVVLVVIITSVYQNVLAQLSAIHDFKRIDTTLVISEDSDT